MTFWRAMREFLLTSIYGEYNLRNMREESENRKRAEALYKKFEADYANSVSAK